jgi:FlaG/FlaF family flagellin (archaellin)
MSWAILSVVSHRTRTERASVPVIGTIALVAVTLVVALTLGTVVLGQGSTPDPAPMAVVDLTVEGDTLTFTHESGEPLDVRTLSLRVSVDGEPLTDQPPVPFFSASGFEPGPTGPFNTASDPEWSVGETASLTVAGTNSPPIDSGSTVSVRIYGKNGVVVRTETQV